MFDIFGIGESLTAAFVNMAEMVYPILNQFNLTYYGTSYNPFEPLTGVFKLLLVVYLLLIVTIGATHITANINKYQNKTTFKKSILIMVFCLFGFLLANHLESKQQVVPFNINLVYVKEGKTGSDDEINNNRGYKAESSTSKYDASSFNFSDNKYLTFSTTDFGAGEDSHLGRSYKEEDSYMNYIVGLNPVYLPYKSFTTQNNFLSNIDLLGSPVPADVKNIYDTGVGEAGHFSENEYSAYMAILLGRDTNILGKKGIIPNEQQRSENPEKYPIVSKGSLYYYEGFYRDPLYTYKTDLIFSKKENKDAGEQITYIVVPYYDIVKFFNPSLPVADNLSNMLSFVTVENETTGADEDSIQAEISPELKQAYIALKRELDTFTGIADIKGVKDKEVEQYKDQVRADDNKFFLHNVEDQRLKYVADFITWYNAEHNTEYAKYDITAVKGILDAELRDLATKLQQYKEAIIKVAEAEEYLVRNPTASDAPSRTQKLETVKNAIGNTASVMAKTVEMVTSRKVGEEEEIVNMLEVFKVPNINIHFDGTGTDTRIRAANIQETQAIINKTLSEVTRIRSGLNSNLASYTAEEQKLAGVLTGIEKFNDNLPAGMSAINTKNEPLYTLIRFYALGDNAGFSFSISGLLLQSICTPEGKIISDVKEKFEASGVTLTSDIIDCSANGGKGEIGNPEKLREVISLVIMADMKAKFYLEKYNIIPYLGALGKESKRIDQIYKPGDAQDIKNEFLIHRIQFGEYKFVSPLVYYNALLNDKADQIPGIFINLLPIRGSVFTPRGVYNLTIGETGSWYGDLDAINGSRYAQNLSFQPIPLAHHIPLIIIKLFTDFAYFCTFALLLQIFITLLRTD